MFILWFTAFCFTRGYIHTLKERGFSSAEEGWDSLIMTYLAVYIHACIYCLPCAIYSRGHMSNLCDSLPLLLSRSQKLLVS